MSLAAESLNERLKWVDEHVRYEALHDLDGVMSTFGDTARFHLESMGEFAVGNEQVRAVYADLFQGIPDLNVAVKQRYVTDDNVVVELMLTGTQTGTWRGLPPTGRAIAVPMCAIFWFDEDNRIAGEKVYFDMLTTLKQLGVM